ncbi:MAG: 50S ribosomal protein L21 [Clostridia bacterium]|nr:50S ribosomal protein L21 [Clostridia bacterium]
MYAIVEVGGKQYKVEPDKFFKVEKLDANVGDKVELPCLLVADGEKVEIAANGAKKAKAVCEVLEIGKEKKVVVYKYKPKKNERKKQGHRQPFTKLKVVSIAK